MPVPNLLRMTNTTENEDFNKNTLYQLFKI